MFPHQRLPAWPGGGARLARHLAPRGLTRLRVQTGWRECYQVRGSTSRSGISSGKVVGVRVEEVVGRGLVVGDVAGTDGGV